MWLAASLEGRFRPITRNKPVIRSFPGGPTAVEPFALGELPITFTKSTSARIVTRVVGDSEVAVFVNFHDLSGESRQAHE